MSNEFLMRIVSVLEITTPLSAVNVTACRVSYGCSAKSAVRSAVDSPAEINKENNIVITPYRSLSPNSIV